MLGNDSDIDGDALTAVLFSNPTNGTVNLNPDGGFSYIPDANFTGTDSFIYYANDGTTDGNPSFVNITVTPTNDDVVARDDVNTTAPNTSVSGNVLTNDIDENPDGPTESLTVSTTGMIATTGGGSVTMASDGSYTYTPATGFTGVDSFEYTVTDGLTSDIGEVSITVSGGVVNISPIANDDFLSTDVDTPLTIVREDLLGNDSDPDGDPTQLIPSLVVGPSNGMFSSDGNGNVVYIPNAGFIGTDTFTYQVSDGQDLSDIATVTITVSEAPNSVPVPGFDSLATAIDTQLTFYPEDLLANDFDAEGDPLEIVISTEPSNGTLDLNNPKAATPTPPPTASPAPTNSPTCSATASTKASMKPP